MNSERQYQLEKGSKKYKCPQCTKSTFVLYVDTFTGGKLPTIYGRCDRESKCAYHHNPYLDGYAKNEREKLGNGQFQASFKPHPMQPKPQTVFFDFDTFKRTLEAERYEKNTFIQNLLNRVEFPFEIDEVTKVIEIYRLGTIANGYREGANTFPFIDVNNNVRAIQVKQFDTRNQTTSTDFLHSIIEKYATKNNKPLPEWLKAYKNNERKVSCLFGEHLLSKYPTNPVALVEAPKTAIYGTLYFGAPESSKALIWLAVYNKSSFNFNKLKVLKGRSVYVFPDLSKNGSTFKEWEVKAKVCESGLKGTKFIFSDLLERLAPEQDKNEGNDLADYLIKQDWRKFRKPKTTKQQPTVEVERTEIAEPDPIQEPPSKKTQNWNVEIEELENYFSTIDLPEHSIKLDQSRTILNCSLFVESHISTLKRNNGNPTFKPYLLQLQEFKQILTLNVP